MMNRLRWYLAVSIAGVIAACSTPTDVCGCPPSRSAVIVRGILQDGAGRPVSNARIVADGIARGKPFLDSLPVSAGMLPVRTDADGTFRVVALSTFGPDTLQLRLAILPEGVTSAPPFAVILARFRFERGPLDSVIRTFSVP